MANSTKISEYSTTAANNTSIDSIDIDENCAASGINNALRSVLKHQADAFTQGTPIALDQTNNRVGIGTTSPATTLHISGNSNNTAALSDTVTDFALKFDSATTTNNFSNAICFAEGTNVNASIASFDGGSGGAQGLVFGTGASNTERLRIDSSGNVGIGTSSPASIAHALHATSPKLTLERDSTSLANNNVIGEIAMAHKDSNDAGTAVRIIGRAEGTAGAAGLAFNTGTPSSISEAMRITSGGNVGIGTTPSGARLDINTSANEIGTDILCESTSQTSDVFRISASRNTTNNTYFLMRASCNGVADRFQIRDSGNVKNANNSYGAISDERMKENIVDANSQWDDIKALQLRNYNMIGEDATQIGVIAQELEAAGMNGLVEEGDFFHATANPDGETRKSVKYSVLYMKAIGALQEAMTRIETLETEMTALKARVTALEA